jgi:outer membrane protein assembly factor BamA
VPEVTPVALGGRDVHWVFGVGARVELPFGPARVDVSWSPRPKPNGDYVKPRNSVQFAIGSTF